jgi:membrane protein DedA with SNARE-associated domain
MTPEQYRLFTVVGGVIWATVIGLGAYYLGDSLHRPTGPLGIALTVLVLCLFAFCIFILLRNVRRLEDVAERMPPGPLDLVAGKKQHEAEQEH